MLLFIRFSVKRDLKNAAGLTAAGMAATRVRNHPVTGHPLHECDEAVCAPDCPLRCADEATLVRYSSFDVIIFCDCLG